MPCEKVELVFQRIAESGCSFEMIYQHDPLPRSSRLTHSQHLYVVESYSCWKKALHMGRFELLGWDHLFALMMYAFAIQCDVRCSDTSTKPISSALEHEYWCRIWLCLFRDQMLYQARQAPDTTTPYRNNIDVEMDADLPSSRMITSPFAQHTFFRPRNLSDYDQLSEILRGATFFWEVIDTVKARIMNNGDFDKHYAKLHGRRLARDLHSRLVALSLEDRPKMQSHTPNKMKPRLMDRDRCRKARILDILQD